MKYWKHIIGVLVLAAVEMAVAAAFVYFSDVYGYRKFNGSIWANINPRRYNAVLARKMDYDSAFLGSSLSSNFRCSLLDRLFNCRSMKFAFSGAKLQHVVFLLDYCAEYRPLKMVVMDYDPVRRPVLDQAEFPFELYHAEHLPLANYFSFEELKPALQKLLRPGTIRRVSRDEYASWSHRLAIERVGIAKDLHVLAAQKPKPKDGNQEYRNALDEFERYLLPALKRHPEIKVMLFFPPRSIMSYSPDRIDDYNQLKTAVIEKLMTLPNVELFDFQTADWVFDLDSYGDTWHYKAAINDWILEKMKAGEYRLTAENYPAKCQELVAMVKNYDYKKACRELGLPENLF